VLVILITVAAISIIWVAILPMIKTGLEFRELDGRVSVVGTGGYTLYDADREVAMVQVKREPDEGVMDRIVVSFLVDGNSVSSSVVAPPSGGTKTYAFDLSGYGEPGSVSVAPIFVSGTGKEKVGSITSDVKISSKTISEVKGAVYEIGEDYRGDESCLIILDSGGSVGDGVYTIDLDGEGGNASFEVNCDMTRDGGGWTLIVKTWYVSATVSAGVFGETGAVGDVSDGLVHLGNGYKLSDEVIREIIGSNEKFDILADQSGYNTAYSTGNYEYVVLRDYTGYWRFDGHVAASTTTTTFQSYRASDDALAWTGNLACGIAGGAVGINCGGVGAIENNPQGGAGCDINMGLWTNAGWHHFYMSHANQDTYLYICNGAQHSSSNRFSHRFWVREG